MGWRKRSHVSGGPDIMSDETLNRLEATAKTIAKASAERFATLDRSRILVAIAGAPGSGKSTLAEQAVELLQTQHGRRAAIFPMDGYHYDDAVLEDIGRRPFKGAIDTFDAHGLRHMLARLKANEDDAIAVPVFDRSIEIARAGARLIAQSTEIIVCEGNYLLAKQAPWNLMKPIFDLTVFIDVDVETLRHRLEARWRGFGLSQQDIARKVEENDLPNGIFIMSNSAEPDLRLNNGA